MKFKKDLTTRQYNLYEYLKEQTDFKNIKDIMNETEFYGEYSDSVNCGGARALKKDIRALRASSNEAIRTIISTSKGYKIPTKKEYQPTSESKWNSIKKQIILQVKQDRKAGLDNQTRLVFGYEKPIIEAFKEVEA